MALLNNGPLRSSELTEKLVQNLNISEVTARKRLSRVKSPVNRLSINLPNNEKVFYREEQKGSSRFVATVTDILIKTNSAAGRALIGLQTVGGVIPLSLFAKASGTSASYSNKHIYYQRVIDQLSEIDLVHINNDSANGVLVCLHGMADIPSMREATYLVENITLSIVKNWLANLGISSLKSLKTREENPQYGPFAWDIVGPSYLGGVVKYKKGKIENAFVVGDIILNKKITREQLSPFFYKLDSLRSQKNIRPFLAIIIADSFESNALSELRKKGVVVAMPKTILGKENAIFLRELIKLIEKADESIKKDPEKFLDIFQKINKIEGAALNLRSVAFDFIIARLYSLNGFNCEIRKKIITKNKKERAEIDVVAERADKIVCIEGKAMSPSNFVKKDELEDWIDRVTPRIKQWLKERERTPANRILEFYSSTDYDQEAKEYLIKIKETHKKVEINFYKGTDVVEMLRKLNQSSLVNIFQEQFM